MALEKLLNKFSTTLKNKR